jgi:subfamily B ATP-binding cassette protein MsbA
MIAFLSRLLRLCRPYKRRLILGVLMGLLGGVLEPLLLLCIKVVMEVVFPGAITATEFSVHSFKDLPAFAQQVKAPASPMSRHLAAEFSPATREKLSEYNGGNSPVGDLGKSLAGELNLVILGPSLAQPDLLAGVKLDPETVRLLAQKPVRTELLNRAILESAYPGELVAAKVQFLDRVQFLDHFPRVKQHLSNLARWLPTPAEYSGGLNAILIVLLIPAMMLLRGVAGYFNVYLLQWVSIRAICDLRTRLFNHLLNLPLAFLNKVSTGELLSRVSSDTLALQSSISNSLVVIVKDPATLICLIIFLLWQQPMLMLVSMIVFPVCLVPIIIYSRKVRQSSRGVQAQYAELNKIMHESFTGNRIIKAYNLESNALEQFRAGTNRFIGHYMRSVRAGEMPGPMIEFFGSIGIAGLFYYILLGAHKPIDASDFVVFVGSVYAMYRPIKSISRLYSQMEQANAASERVFELLDIQSNLVEPANPLPLKAAGADIHFEHIDFNYEEKAILQQFQLTVKSGQLVALVGHSGSGKTTVANLLLRFYDPQKGAVRIGDVDIRQVTTTDLRHQIAVVTQDALLFDDTIRRNIELGRPGATEVEIIAAAKHAHAHEFIMEKPQGYDTLIGEKGVMLSGGQKQRLTIARAILKNAPILILDEATSALDLQSERIVQVALEDLMQNRTTICIAHRLSTIQNADVIVVLDQGRIMEMGRHGDLLARDGFYRRLYEMSDSSSSTAEIKI